MKKNKKYFIIFLSIMISIDTICAFPSYYENYYENLNNESVSAYSNVSGNTVFDFIPFEINNKINIGKYFISASMRLTKGGGDFGPDENVSRGENLDMLKHFTFIYNQRKDFKFFASYYTPYKSIINTKDVWDEVEIIKKRDMFSVGSISIIGKNTISLSLDLNYSLQKKTSKQSGTNNESEEKHEAVGMSNKILVDIMVNRRSSMFFGFSSPVYFQKKLGDNFDNEDLYFNEREINAGFTYDDKKWFSRYSATYKEFKTFENQDGFRENDDKRVTNEKRVMGHPWLIEHRFVGGKHISKFVKVAMDYKLTPSYYNGDLSGMSDIGDLRHSIGAFIGYDYDNVIFNLYLSDSRFLSNKSLGVTFFQMDIGFSF